MVMKSCEHSNALGDKLAYFSTLGGLALFHVTCKQFTQPIQDPRMSSSRCVFSKISILLLYFCKYPKRHNLSRDLFPLHD